MSPLATKTPAKTGKAAAKPSKLTTKPPKFSKPMAFSVTLSRLLVNGYSLFFQENFNKLATPETKTGLISPL